MIFISGIIGIIIHKNTLCTDKFRVVYFRSNCVNSLPLCLKTLIFLSSYYPQLLRLYVCLNLLRAYGLYAYIPLTHLYIYTYLCYIYIYRERERDR